MVLLKVFLNVSRALLFAACAVVVLGPDVAGAQAQSSESLPPIVVEGEIRDRALGGEPSTVQVPSGEGAKQIDAPVNELGISLKNMERLQELASERPGQAWWLGARRGARVWQSQLHSDLSADQNLRARVVGERPGRQITIEGGVERDHRDLVVLENPRNPFDGSLARESRISNSKDRAFAKLKWAGREHQALADGDFKSEDIHAGALLTGVKKSAQQSLGASWRDGSFEVLPFLQGRQIEFESRLSPLLSNSTTGVRGGAQSDARFEKFTLKSELHFEELTRVYADQSRTRFERYGAGATLARPFEYEFADLKLHAGGELASDHIDASAAPSRGLQSTRQSLEPAVWDFGAELSSPKRYTAGMAVKARRFSLIPTPSQRFGDGALLAGAENLEPETGVRASIGPWFHTATSEFEIAGFHERIVNAPVMVAVSPSSARTVAIGGVWAQGLEARAATVFGAFKLQALYTFQEALNDSEINWQKGKPVPGRPRHVIKTGFDYRHPRWRAGADYAYRSEDALDLAGLWAKPPHHDLNAYVGYGARDWEVRLAGAKLLAAQNGLPSAQFGGQAAPDLLEPTIEQTEVRLQCEFLM